jgi:hypothetical protein
MDARVKLNRGKGGGAEPREDRNGEKSGTEREAELREERNGENSGT